MRGFRLVRRLLLLALVPAATGSCLVLSDPDFRGQDECVPFFLTREANPAVSSREVLTGEEFRGSVPMRTCALTLPYEARVFVDGVFTVNQNIPPTGEELREVPVLVDIKNLSKGCHFVEVFVSSRFRASGSDFTQPERSGDVTFLLWTFLNDTDATVTSCGGGS